MMSFTKKILLQNDSEHSKNNFVHTSYKPCFFKWMKTDISFDFDSLYMYMHIRCIFQKARTFHYITLLKGDNSVFSLTWNTYHFFLYKMVTFITLPYLLLMLSSNFNINGCCFFIFYMLQLLIHIMFCVKLWF